jgi:hypothetical protein
VHNNRCSGLRATSLTACQQGSKQMSACLHQSGVLHAQCAAGCSMQSCLPEPLFL